MNKRIVLGIFLTCAPLPMFLYSQILEHSAKTASAQELMLIFGALFGAPALLLICGYRYAAEKKVLSADRFIHGAALVGLTLAALVLIPMSLPFLYFRPTDMPFLSSALHVLLMAMVLVLVCTGYAALFWIVSLKHIVGHSDQASTT